MPTASVLDVARYILEKLGSMTAMKLQKLVYYCQAWSLVWDGFPLFSESIEAWANGPVVRKLFEAHREQFNVYPSGLQGNIESLTAVEKQTIDSVLDYYGDKPSQWLSDLTHMEDPWKNARADLPDGTRSDREITLASMHQYYESISPKE